MTHVGGRAVRPGNGNGGRGGNRTGRELGVFFHFLFSFFPFFFFLYSSSFSLPHYTWTVGKMIKEVLKVFPFFCFFKKKGYRH